MCMLFKGTFRELSKFVSVGIPELSSKSGKIPLGRCMESLSLEECFC